MAWLSLQRARLLGYKSTHLEEKLAPHTKKPIEVFNDAPKSSKIFRFIKLSSEEEAKIIVGQILQGKPFENLEIEMKNEKVDETSFGLVQLNELPDSAAESLKTLQPYSSPVIIKTGSDFRIMQSVAPFDPVAWRTTIETTSNTSKNSKAKTPAKIAQKNETGVTNPAPSPIASTEAEEDAPEVQHNMAKIKKEQLTTQLAAYYALESWKNAWQAADVTKYLAAYSSEFTPPGNMDLATWKQKRTASLTRPKFIHVKIKDPVIELLTDSHLLITFTQNFESDTYQDSVIKILTMVLENGSWRIKEERSIQEPNR